MDRSVEIESGRLGTEKKGDEKPWEGCPQMSDCEVMTHVFCRKYLQASL